MTLEGFKNATKDLTIVENIGFTSLQKVYIDRIKIDTFKINDSSMTFEYESDHGFQYIFDINDVNSIILNKEKVNYNSFNVI